MSDPKPKICVLTTTPLVVQFFLKHHLSELSQYFNVTLVCNPKSDSYLPPLDLPVRQIAIGIERKISPLRDLKILFELYRLFRREHFDLVVSVVPKAGLLGMVASFFARIPRRVHIFQGEVWASRSGLMRLLLKTIDWLVARMSTHALAVSVGEKHFLEQQGVAPTRKITVLGAGSICGVDTERFKPDSTARHQMRAMLGISEDAIICIFLGRLTADKGILDLVRAFGISATNNKNLWLLLVGPDEENMEEQLSTLVQDDIAPRILVKSFTQEPERFLAAADFLCLPSYREGFGMVILEAAAVGIPAIGSRIYGVSDAIDEGHTGLLVPVGDVHALSEAITQLSEKPNKRAQLSVAAQERVKSSFRQKNVVAGYVDYFRKLF